MDIYWFGQACFKIKGKNATVFTDPFKPEFTGLKLPKDLEADIVLSSHSHDDHNNLEAFPPATVKISGPGEYEARGVSITGVQVWHDDSQGSQRGKNTIYNIIIDGLNIVHLGDLGHKLTESQIQDVGSADILMVPVGGVYTIDAKGAEEVITQLEPKIIIPMHYLVPGLKFELHSVESFLKDVGEASQPLPKLSITKDKLPEEPEIVVLNKA